jgi:hypothetical protein
MGWLACPAFWFFRIFVKSASWHIIPVVSVSGKITPNRGAQDV